MTDSKQVVQFGEMVRQAFQGSDMEVQVWLGDVMAVRTGDLPAILLDEICPACHQARPHVLKFLGNWNQFVCQMCGFRHSEQLVRGGKANV